MSTTNDLRPKAQKFVNDLLLGMCLMAIDQRKARGSLTELDLLEIEYVEQWVAFFGVNPPPPMDVAARKWG